jgi:hypothetical protein
LTYPAATDGHEDRYPQWLRDAFHKHAWDRDELDYVRRRIAALATHVESVSAEAIEFASPHPPYVRGTWRSACMAHPFVARFLSLVGGEVRAVTSIKASTEARGALPCSWHGEHCDETCPMRGLLTFEHCECRVRTDAKGRAKNNGHQSSCEVGRQPAAPKRTAVLSPADRHRITASARISAKDRKQREKAARQQKQIRLL